MGELYTCAEQVLVWLGDAGDDSDLVCGVLPGLVERLRAVEEERGWGFPVGMDEVEALGFPPPEDKIWRAVLALYAREWFQRLWVVQEIVLAPSAVFLCGRHKVEWDAVVDFAWLTTKSGLLEAVTGLHTRALGLDRLDRVVNGTRMINDSRQLQGGLGDPERALDGLDMALGLMQSQGAAVKVDHVYAILGMLPEELELEVVVDYSEETKQNYGMVHAAFFRQCLERLADWPANQFPPFAAAREDNVPSWCPRWGSGWDPAALSRAGGCRAGRPTATSNLQSFNSPWPATAKEDGILRIAGIPADTVRDVIGLDRAQAGDPAEVLKVFKTCAAHTPDGVDGPERLLGTLLGVCGWVDTSLYSGAPHGRLLDGLFEFLESVLAYDNEHKDRAGYVPIDLGMPDYLLDKPGFWRRYLSHAMTRWWDRSVVVTEHGRVALVPRDTRPGDTVCVFLGATLPQVISRHDDGVHWTYVGPGAVDGLVHGEVFDAEDWEDKKETFCLR